jgi:hypothetical protein
VNTPKYEVGQTVWVWKGDQNFDVTIAHIIPAGTVLHNGSKLWETQYLMEIHGPDIFYDMFGENVCHSVKNCRPFPLHSVCSRDLKKERADLIRDIDYAEAARKGHANNVERSKGHIRELRQALEALNEEIKQTELPVP